MKTFYVGSSHLQASATQKAHIKLALISYMSKENQDQDRLVLLLCSFLKIFGKIKTSLLGFKRSDGEFLEKQFQQELEQVSIANILASCAAGVT
jgi:hypothetical protein